MPKKKDKYSKLETGFYWGYTKSSNWELLLIRKFKSGEMYIYCMAWDISEDPEKYEKFIPLKLVTPDGKPYIE